ncbi:MAG TPA: hypothetical protein VFA60_07795 [Terriglobales bacterium]|nr:hypothetical protein [Terriglobales bacterium]
MLRQAALLALLGLAGVWAGCGSSNSVSSTPPPTRTTPSPTPTPNPSTAPEAFFATLFNSVGAVRTPAGQVTVDAAANHGAGNVQLTNGVALTTTQVLQFCPFAGAFGDCITIPVTPAPAGSNFQFPSTGSFAGIFHVIEGGQETFVGAMGGTAGVSFRAALLPASSITFGIGQIVGAAPISSGSVSITGQTMQVIIDGTTPNQTFGVSICSILGTINCQTLGSVTSNATGSVSGNVTSVPSGFAGVVLISDSAGPEFISGFRVQ